MSSAKAFYSNQKLNVSVEEEFRGLDFPEQANFDLFNSNIAQRLRGTKLRIESQNLRSSNRLKSYNKNPK